MLKIANVPFMITQKFISDLAEIVCERSILLNHGRLKGK